MSIVFNGTAPGRILYNGSEATLYYNGSKIWPTYTNPVYEFQCSALGGYNSPISLQGIKVNEALIPESALIGACFLIRNSPMDQIIQYGPDGEYGYKALAADSAHLADWCVWKKVTFQYTDPVTSVSWHTHKYSQPDQDVMFTLHSNSGVNFPSTSGTLYYVGEGSEFYANYFDNGTITYTNS